MEVEGWAVCGRASARIGYRKVSSMALTGLAEASRSNRSRAVGERGYGCGVRDAGGRSSEDNGRSRGRPPRRKNSVGSSAGKLGLTGYTGNYFPVTHDRTLRPNAFSN